MVIKPVTKAPRTLRSPAARFSSALAGSAGRAQGEADDLGRGAAAEGDLLDVGLDVPVAHRTAGQEQHVARSEGPGRIMAVGDRGRTFEEVDRLVDLVDPLELARRAVPDQGAGETVVAARERRVAGDRCPLADPARLDRGRPQLHGGHGRNHRFRRQGHPPLRMKAALGTVRKAASRERAGIFPQHKCRRSTSLTRSQRICDRTARLYCFRHY